VSVDRELLEAMAGYFLIRVDDAWTGRRARLVVVVSLLRLNRELPPARVGQLARVVHSLGRELPPLPGIERALPWDEEALLDIIGEALPSLPLLEEETRMRLVTVLASRVRGMALYSTKAPDWISIITQSAVRAGWESDHLSLADKLALSTVIEDVLEDRLTAIVAEASRQAGVSTAELVQRLAAAVAEEPHKPSRPSAPAGPSTCPQVLDERLSRLRPRVHPRQREAFVSWFSRLNERLQKAVLHGVERAEASPFDSSRTRPIKLQSSPLVLRELKVQSRKLHLRLLYRMEPFELLSFGLRRDLDALITQACRVVSAP